MKTIYKSTVLVTVLLLFSILATPIASQDNPLSKTLVIGSELDYPPFAMANEQGEAVGFSVDLFKAVARVMGLKVQFRVGPWNEVRDALEKGEIDALPLVSYSKERDQVFDFTTPHTVSYAAIFIREGEPVITSEAALQDKSIIVMQSDATHDYLIKRQKTDRLHLVSTVPEALRLLATGKGDCALVPRLVGLLTVKKLHLTHLEITGPNIAAYGRGYGFAVKAGNNLLLNYLNQGLSIIKANGQYDDIYDKWFGIVDPRGISLEQIYRYALISFSIFAVLLSVALVWSWSLQREIKQRRQAEASLQETNQALTKAKEAAEAANRAKSVFLANMSHELRTPLHAILGFSQLMGREPTATPEQRESLRIINRSGEHLLSLISDVLDMSKIEAGRVALNEENIDLHQLLKDVTGMMSIRAENQTIRFFAEYEITCLIQFIKIDASKLRQILINLIGNAIKFTEVGGVTVRVRSQLETVTTPKHLLFFEIEDTGIGIAEEHLERIFEAFVQVGSSRLALEGTGLGLPITRRYIQLMGGDIQVTSQIDEGTLFKFHLPVTIAEADAIEQHVASHRIIGLALHSFVPRILVVDDVKESRLLLKKLLTEVGFEVWEATNGQEALAIFEQQHPHLVWMDMRMPIMDGYEATKRIKATPIGQKTPVIALTASSFDEQKAEILAMGCDDFVRKPFREHKIFEVMAKHLNIEYCYESIDLETAPPQIKSEPAWISTALAALPKPILTELRQALKELDIDAVIAVIHRIEQQDTTLAKAMMSYTHHFQYEPLIHFLESIAPYKDNDDER